MAGPLSRSIGVKARIASVEAMLPRVAALADGPPERIEQDDTFFCCPNGRLTLRAFAGGGGELLFYRRPAGAGPRESWCRRVPASEPDALRVLLSEALGEIGRVRKRRLVFMIGAIRAHLDQVSGLGDFLELEAAQAPGQDAEVGRAPILDLLDRLDITPVQLIEGAYIELLGGGH